VGTGLSASADPAVELGTTPGMLTELARWPSDE